MSLQEWLKGLIKVEIKNVKLSIDFSLIKLISNNKSQKKVVIVDKYPTINLYPLSKSEKKLISSSLPNSLSNGTKILDDGFHSKADDYKKKISLGDNQKLINYFKDKIPIEDLTILRASLYLRTVLESHGDTQSIKYQIMQRYGNKGRNIANLCTGGYFENYFIPLYEEMAKRQNFVIKQFQDVYSEIVRVYPFAIFVNHRMNDKDVQYLILNRIEFNRKHGIAVLNIHGIGKTNITRIKNAVDKIQTNIVCTKDILEENNLIVIKLRFNAESEAIT